MDHLRQVQGLIDEALAAYSASIDGAVAQWQSAANPRRAFGDLLHPLAVLFATEAEIHPFRDGNSRTRTFLIQVEITRLGGHPLLLADNGWAVYSFNSYAELHDYLCAGWCAYEYYLKWGVSPYVALSHTPTPNTTNSADSWRTLQPDAMSISSQLYDSHNDLCLLNSPGPTRPPTEGSRGWFGSS